LPGSGQSCSTEARATGLLSTERGRLVFNDAPAKIRAIHCLDVDAFDQAGCVSAYEVHVGEKRGCRLHFQLTRSTSGDSFTVGAFNLRADSLCPGWHDNHEGLYELDEDALSIVGPLQVKPGHEHLDWTCFEGLVRLAGSVKLTHDRLTHDRLFSRTRVVVDVESLTVRGTIGSEGLTDIPCVKKPEPKPKPKPMPKPKPEPPPKPVVPLAPKEHRLDLGASIASFEVLSRKIGDTVVFDESEIAAAGFRLRYSFTPLPPGVPFSLYAGFENGVSLGGVHHSFSTALGVGVLIPLSKRLEFQPRLGLEVNRRMIEVAEGMSVSDVGLGIEFGATARLRLGDTTALHLDYAIILRADGPPSPLDSDQDLLGGYFSRLGGGVTLTL
jgi:hypothetical protein